jgi:ABC-type spermidine/putrescine transport system permease subunit II
VRRPFFLATLTWLYVVWSLLPVLIAVQFSFNSGRSRSTPTPDPWRRIRPCGSP